jgi:hypothetical protein
MGDSWFGVAAGTAEASRGPSSCLARFFLGSASIFLPLLQWKKIKEITLEKTKKRNEVNWLRISSPKTLYCLQAKMSDYSVCAYRVLKKVDPGMGISSKGMAIINSLVRDVLTRLAAVPSANYRQR